MIAKTAPATATEIRSTEDDDFAPGAVIGYVLPLDYPEGRWVALHVDYETGDVRRWSADVATFETAEAFVRADYRKALPRLRAEAAEWAADYCAALAQATVA